MSTIDLKPLEQFVNTIIQKSLSTYGFATVTGTSPLQVLLDSDRDVNGDGTSVSVATNLAGELRFGDRVWTEIRKAGGLIVHNPVGGQRVTAEPGRSSVDLAVMYESTDEGDWWGTALSGSSLSANVWTITFIANDNTRTAGLGSWEARHDATLTADYYATYVSSAVGRQEVRFGLYAAGEWLAKAPTGTTDTAATWTITWDPWDGDPYTTTGVLPADEE